MSYVKNAIAHLRTVCRACGRRKWQSHGEGDAALALHGTPPKRSPFVNAAHVFARTPAVGNERIRELADACKSKLKCPWDFPMTLPDGRVVPACGAPQPQYRISKENNLVILHDYAPKQLALLRDPEERLWALRRMEAAEIRRIVASADVLTLAEMGYRIDAASIPPTSLSLSTPPHRQPQLLSHPENFVMLAQLVLPNAVRPSIHLTDGSRCRGEDDVTRAYVGIAKASQEARKACERAVVTREKAEAAGASRLRRAREHRNAADAAVAKATAAYDAALELASAQLIGTFGDAAAALKRKKQLIASSISHGTDTLQRQKQGQRQRQRQCARVPALTLEVAANTKDASERALAAADSELADALLAIEAVCTKDDVAARISRDVLAVECAALVSPDVRLKVKVDGVKEHKHGRASRRKQQGLKERLTGKKGRMRGNNTGRRVDFSARTVIGPDALHNIWELGVPSIIMNTLTRAIRVTDINIAEMRAHVRRGAGESVDNGAVNVIRPDTTGAEVVVSLTLLDAAARAELSAALKVGWTVERMLIDDDWVLFNRQPSLHKGSMMAFRIYRVRGHTFKLPLPCTPSFNADFDGDEMNMHAMQTLQAIAEAQELMSVPQQMVTPASNSVNIALVQDALPLARLLSAKGALLSREEAMQLTMCMQFNLKGAHPAELAAMPPRSTMGETGFASWLGSSGSSSPAGLSPSMAVLKCAHVESFLPAPAILKGTTFKNGHKTVHGPAWTGKQVFSWLLPADFCLLKVHEDGVRPGSAPLFFHTTPTPGAADRDSDREREKERERDRGKDRDRERWTSLMPYAELLALAHDETSKHGPATDAVKAVQSWLDDDAVVYVKNGELLCGRLCKQTVGRVAGGFVHALWRNYGAWAAAKWVSDAQRVLNTYGLTHSVCISITDCVPSEASEKKVDDLIAEAMGHADALLVSNTPAHVVEVRTHRILQNLMREAGAAVLADMDPDNALLQITRSGAKGTLNNITQIAALLGPQSVFGARVRMRASISGLRTLATFAPDDARVDARGFVSNSLLRGLTPSEFFFHQMASREGVVNTSINTAETGYNYSRMVHGEQSAATAYDGSVRAGNNQLVTLHYGGDDYDGSKLERAPLPHGCLAWSNAQFCRRLGGGTVGAVGAVGDAALLAARDILRAVRAHWSGAGPADLAAPFPLPVNLEALVEGAKEDARAFSSAFSASSASSGSPPSSNSVPMERRIAHLAKRTLEFLDFVTRAHAKLAAQPLWTRHRSSTLVGALLRSATASTTTAADFGDPGRVARAVYTLQLAPGVALTRHNLSPRAIDVLLKKAALRYREALVAPGEGVGALGASSMGEPSTQLSFAYDTEIVWAGHKRQMGDVVEEALATPTLPRMHIAASDTTIVNITAMALTIKTVDQDGACFDAPVTALTRHPPNGSLVRVTLQSGRVVEGTLAKSFLVHNSWSYNPPPSGGDDVKFTHMPPSVQAVLHQHDAEWLSPIIIPIAGADLRVGMHMPVDATHSTKTHVEKQEQDMGARLVWDAIVDLERVACTTPYVYDLTVPTTLNFCLASGLFVRDTLNTFHSTGAGNITNAPEGLPRFKQLINAQDTAATAKMTIRFQPWMAQSEARVRAFAQGAARVPLSEVIEASVIAEHATMPLGTAIDFLKRPKATATATIAITTTATTTAASNEDGEGAADGFRGLRHLRALEALACLTATATATATSCNNSLDGDSASASASASTSTEDPHREHNCTIASGAAAANPLYLETASADKAAARVKKVVSKAVDAALAGSAALRDALRVDTLKKRRAACSQSGADALGAASRYIAVLRLSKSALFARGLDVDTVSAAVQRVLGKDAVVVSAEPVCEDWVLYFRPLDVPTRAGVSLDAWVALSTDEQRVLEKAVTEATHDALIDALVVHGHPALIQAVARKETRITLRADGALDKVDEWVVDTEGSDLRALALVAGVDACRTTTNNVREVNRVLGIEAAVDVLHAQLHAVLCTSGPYVDPRHTRLMALIMCRGGVFLPLNRHKLKKMGVAGWLQMASYEQTKEVFETGALFAEADPLAGPIEKMVVGQPFNVGTGCFDVICLAPPVRENVEEGDDDNALVAPMSSLAYSTHVRKERAGATEVVAALMSQSAASQRKKQARDQARDQAMAHENDTDTDAEEKEKDDDGIVVSIHTRTKSSTKSGTKSSTKTSTNTNDERRRAEANAAETNETNEAVGHKRKRCEQTVDTHQYAPSNPAPHDVPPRALHSAIHQVADLARGLRDSARAGHSAALALSACGGHFNGVDGVWRTGVPVHTFQRVQAALAAYAHWSDAPPLLLYDNGKQGERKGESKGKSEEADAAWEQRTHDTFEVDGYDVVTTTFWKRAHEGVLTTTHTRTIRHGVVDLSSSHASPGTLCLGARVMLTAEIPVHESGLPTHVVPTRSCISQRRVYRKGPWSVVLTREWVGKNNVEAERKQVAAMYGDMSETVLNVRVELSVPDDVLGQHGCSDASVAYALLARLGDIVGIDALSCVVCTGTTSKDEYRDENKDSDDKDEEKDDEKDEDMAIVAPM
jgi:DNA-directed RNA polymerase beta' subunit